MPSIRPTKRKYFDMARVRAMIKEDIRRVHSGTCILCQNRMRCQKLTELQSRYTVRVKK